jgi:3-deoxy-D-manno-octulosonate 8-phosphate phosphatase (KDO 8-P phosphatase)
MLQPIVAKKVRLVGLDVDGVMTDAGVYIGMGADGPVELKRFHIHDSIGIKLLMACDIAVVVVSGRFSHATNLRADELGIEEVVQDPMAVKLPAFQDMLGRRGVRLDEAAFMGDDLPDIPVMKRVGLSVAPANAVPEVLATAALVTEAAGGQGAVREFAEMLLKCRGEWDDAVRQYLVDRGDQVSRTSVDH